MRFVAAWIALSVLVSLLMALAMRSPEPPAADVEIDLRDGAK